MPSGERARRKDGAQFEKGLEATPRPASDATMIGLTAVRVSLGTRPFLTTQRYLVSYDDVRSGSSAWQPPSLATVPWSLARPVMDASRRQAFTARRAAALEQSLGQLGGYVSLQNHLRVASSRSRRWLNSALLGGQDRPPTATHVIRSRDPSRELAVANFPVVGQINPHGVAVDMVCRPRAKPSGLGCASGLVLSPVPPPATPIRRLRLVLQPRRTPAGPEGRQ